MSKPEVYWEDVEIGSELPPMPKIASTVASVKWAAAIGAYNPLMYEDTFARNQGMQGPIVHGQLKLGWLVHFLTGWMGEGGTLKKISCEYRGIDYPRNMRTINEPEDGETWICRGKVVRKYREGEDHCVDLEIGVENGNGRVTTPGTATVILPSRS